ncbi:DUF4932 domain-containing protein [candidate division WOR-3 bacterium]|nr:DUF4932 domain-containing protein [candidate division WOR-3 bacterium]
MKKYLVILFLLLVFVYPTVIPLNATQTSLNVVVDPRLELLAVVQLLSDYGERYGLITQYGFPYKCDVVEYFSPYKKHPAVKLFAKMSADNFSFDAPPAAMLYLSDPPDLNLLLPFTDYLKRRAGGEKQLNQFVDELRDFAHETQFMAFFETHKGTFQQIVGDAYKKIEGIDYIGILEKYYGMKQHSYNIILVSLFTGGYGPRVKRVDGTYDIFNICGPMRVKNGFPIFGTMESFRHLAWHEFSHSFVNPTTERFHKQIAKYSSLYDPISDRMKKQAYGVWQTCVNEHIVRAITTRLAYRESGKEAGDLALQNEKRRGFFYVEDICKRLEQYEKQRGKYPSFEDFYPEIVNVFKEFSERDLGDDFYTIPFAGPLNAVGADRESIILIVPTHEKDKSVQDEIHTYVKKIRDRFFKDSPMLTDEQALKRDLSANAIIVYGTITGNLWLAQHIDELPVRIESNQIVADTIYPGTHLRFITAWPNPQNFQKGLEIYTAQQAEDIIGINSVFHGPTDYVVARGREILREANYNKQNGRWTFK